MGKRELRHARKTVKTYETIATLNGGKLGGEGGEKQPQVIRIEPPPVDKAMVRRHVGGHAGLCPLRAGQTSHHE